MLVLSRKEKQSIMIGDEIVLTVLSIGSEGVRIGVTAPPEVRVNREEIQQRLEQEWLERQGESGS